MSSFEILSEKFAQLMKEYHEPEHFLQFDMDDIVPCETSLCHGQTNPNKSFSKQIKT
jgi:hypothetical protein